MFVSVEKKEEVVESGTETLRKVGIGRKVPKSARNSENRGKSTKIDLKQGKIGGKQGDIGGIRGK